MNYEKVLKPIAVIVFLAGMVTFAVSYSNWSSQTKAFNKTMPNIKVVYSQNLYPVRR